MRSVLVIALLAFALRAEAEDLSLSSSFASVAAFVSATTSYQPESSKTDLAKLFLVPIPEASDGQNKLTIAPLILASESIWANDSRAVVLVTATVPAEAMRSAVGILFLLEQKQGIWHIVDHVRFLAAGKYARIAADSTADTGVGYQLGDDGIEPVVTVRVTRGGRPYSYKAAASYSVVGRELKRVGIDAP